jgi:orotate phosphoribosyltransferase
MRLLQHPRHAAMVSQAAAKHFENRRVDATFAPAVGGIPWGYALAQRFHDCRAVFAERVEGKFALRRGFALQPGEQVLLAEDVITTGGSVSELIALVEDAGAEVMGFAAVVDRSGGRFKPPIDLFSWVQLMLETWEPGDCPLCREGSAAEKPGSAGVKASRR